ncbi:interferon-induced very large GTPase 1-like [Mytilus californianus]|uniref:interferon-induced very large GTPase 1-like n=1 Tax=Mytilus californianus TaxID=6549 RepID=UPI002246D55B|nr:interferon-induced very large GTPase 1-like [Mytilus californianus]
MEINQRAQQLATEMRGAKPTGDILKGKFDLMWETWMTEFNTETSEDSVSIKQHIESLIWDKFSADAAFLECQVDDSEPNTSMMQIDEYTPIKDDIHSSLKRIYGPEIASNIVQMSDDEFQIFQDLIRLEGSIGIIDIADCHIQIKRSLFGFGKDKEDRDTCKKQTVYSTNTLLQKIDMFLDREIALNFNVKYAEHIFETIQRHIESQNKILLSKFHFALTPNYGIMVTTHIIRYAMIWFTNLNVNYRRRHITQSAQNTALGNRQKSGNVVSGSYRKTKPNKKLVKLEGSINTSDILANHISMIKSYEKKNWNTFTDIRNDAVAVTDKMLKKIDTRLTEYNAQDVRFDISFATEILLLISQEIDKHNKHLENTYKFNLLPPYRVMVVTHVQPFITDFLVYLNDKYNKKHSPKGQMEEYKGTVWTLFQNVVDSKTENVIASNFFRKAICKAVTDHLDGLLPIIVQEHIMMSFAHEKYSLMKTIMIDLAEKEDFYHFAVFINDPSEYTRLWMNQYIINEIFDQGDENCTTYGRLAQSQIKKILKQLSKCFSEASRICRNSEMNDISSWIQSFIEHSRELNTIPFSNEDFVHVQNRHVDDLDNYTEIIIVDLEDIENDIVQPYRNTDQYTVQWKENPISGIMEKLWGCTAKCMFCAEPCRHTGKTHMEEDIPHQCIQHRPQGIGGFHWEDTKYLVTEFCNFWVQTQQRYRWGETEKKEYRYYREYKKHFPDWDIVPSSDTSKYWMWVMSKYPNELKERYSVEEPNLPATWKLITKQEAIDSLSFV